MKFSIGDKVVLKRTGEEGEVTAYIGKDMLEVAVKGTAFPVFEDEVDHPYLNWFTDKNRQKKQAAPPEQLPVETEKARPKRLPQGVYLSFMPVYKEEEMEDIVRHLKVFLINELPVPIQFGYSAKFHHEEGFGHEGGLYAYGNLYLHTIDWEDMNTQPRFHWKLSDKEGKFRKEEGVLRIRPSKLFEQVSQLLLKNEPVFSYLLIDDFAEKPKEQPGEKKAASLPPVTAAKPARIGSLAELPRYEVDLHIEQLLPDHKRLSPGEILQLQLNFLERYLYLAIMHRQERMMIIHGLGSGALRDAVHKLLKQVPEVSRFSNEWIGKYGFGATEVVFKY